MRGTGRSRARVTHVTGGTATALTVRRIPRSGLSPGRLIRCGTTRDLVTRPGPAASPTGRSTVRHPAPRSASRVRGRGTRGTPAGSGAMPGTSGSPRLMPSQQMSPAAGPREHSWPMTTSTGQAQHAAGAAPGPGQRRAAPQRLTLIFQPAPTRQPDVRPAAGASAAARTGSPGWPRGQNRSPSRSQSPRTTATTCRPARRGRLAPATRARCRDRASSSLVSRTSRVSRRSPASRRNPAGAAAVSGSPRPQPAVQRRAGRAGHPARPAATTAAPRTTYVSPARVVRRTARCPPARYYQARLRPVWPRWAQRRSVMRRSGRCRSEPDRRMSARPARSRGTSACRVRTPLPACSRPRARSGQPASRSLWTQAGPTWPGRIARSSRRPLLRRDPPGSGPPRSGRPGKSRAPTARLPGCPSARRPGRLRRRVSLPRPGQPGRRRRPGRTAQSGRPRTSRRPRHRAGQVRQQAAGPGAARHAAGTWRAARPSRRLASRLPSSYCCRAAAAGRRT